MALVIYNDFSYETLKLLNNIAVYYNNINLPLTSDKIYKYINNKFIENDEAKYFMENNILLKEIIEKDNAIIFEMNHIYDIFLGFISENNIIKCEILNDNLQIKSTKIPKIIYHDILVTESDNLLDNNLKKNLEYIKKKIFKINSVMLNPYYKYYIKVYFSNKDNINNININGCGILFDNNVIKNILICNLNNDNFNSDDVNNDFVNNDVVNNDVVNNDVVNNDVVI